MVIEGAQLLIPVSGINDDVTSAAILTATAFKGIPPMCTHVR